MKHHFIMVTGVLRTKRKPSRTTKRCVNPLEYWQWRQNNPADSGSSKPSSNLRNQCLCERVAVQLRFPNHNLEAHWLKLLRIPVRRDSRYSIVF